LRKEATGYISATILLFIAISIAYLQPLQDQFNVLLVAGLMFASVVIPYILRRGGVLPSILITRYLPLPLALISPPATEIEEKFRTYILPAVNITIELIKSQTGEKAYKIIKLIKEFFNKELGDINLGNTEAIRKKLVALRLYVNIEDERERRNAQYSLASLIHWISRYRNLAMHSPKVDADPIDAWFALRTALIYIRDKYAQEEAMLYTKCPKCNAINRIKLRNNNNEVRWLREISLKCTKCGYEYKVKITPSLIVEHYQIYNNIRRLEIPDNSRHNPSSQAIEPGRDDGGYSKLN